jgi:hypothetical protein
LLLCIASTGCFKVSRDAGTLRDSVVNGAAARCEAKFEFGVGALTLGLARFGLSYLDLDPEARTALSALRGADVGVYEVIGRKRPANYAKILSSADRAMAARGWDRLVTVIDDGQMVAVFVPKDLRTTRNVRVCLAVLSEREMVVASARSNLEPLLELAVQKSDQGSIARSLIRL